MRSTQNSITYPLVETAGAYAVIGGFLAVFVGLPFGYAAVSYLRIRLGWAVAAAAFAVSGFCMAGCFLLWAFAKVHLVPEGVALSVFGRTFRTYPVEKIQTIYVMERFSIEERNYVFLCISCESRETLAARRERQMKRNPYMRSNIPFRKRKGDWQRTFALEYLRKRACGLPWPILDKNLLFMEYTHERSAFLKQMYPHVPYEMEVKALNYHKAAPILKNPPPDLRCHAVGETPPVIGLLLVLVPSVLLLFLPMTMAVSADFSILSCVWLFGMLLLLALFLDGQRIRFLPEGISAHVFGLEVCRLPAEQIKTIVCFDYRIKAYSCRYLSASSLTLPEIREREEKRMSRTKEGRERLSACRLMDDWDSVAVERYFCRRLMLYGYMDWEQLLIAHSAEREQLCRELYPQALWYAVEGKKINPDDVY